MKGARRGGRARPEAFAAGYFLLRAALDAAFFRFR